MSLNRVVLVGRLTRDPELRYTGSGVAVANGNIACNRPFKNQNGENEADFINFVVWKKAAENLANFMKKGSQIGIDGRIQTRSYEGKDGNMVYVTEVVADSIQFLDSKGGQQRGNNANQYNNPNQQQNTQQQSNFNQSMQGSGKQVVISDSDLPF